MLTFHRMSHKQIRNNIYGFTKLDLPWLSEVNKLFVILFLSDTFHLGDD
jgi:hypothetical protein